MDSNESSKTSFFILRKSGVIRKFGISKSTLHLRIQNGLIPPPINLGGFRAVGWVDNELDATLAAMIAGQSKEEIKNLVQSLIEQRKSLLDNHKYSYIHPLNNKHITRQGGK